MRITGDLGDDLKDDLKDGIKGKSGSKRLHANRPAVCSLVAFVMMAPAGCGPTRTLPPVPERLVEEASIPGMPPVRTWGDLVDEHFVASLRELFRRGDAPIAIDSAMRHADTVDLLALSGGGDNGAFGAGLLCGWTERGDRPEFKLVTGISTGAIIAPFAFLGSEYDGVLRRASTTITEEDVLQYRGILAALYSDALAGTEPLLRHLEEWVSAQVVEAVAVEHRKGRRLLISTVNLEAQRPVIWDMGAIAASGHPRRVDLFRKVILASASIPGAFEPQYIQVEAEGQSYEEMHVDGGTVAQVFLWGGGTTIRTLDDSLNDDPRRRPVRLFVVSNARLHTEYMPLEGRFVDIAGRAVSTLLKTQSLGDIYRLYVIARADGMDFNLVSIPASFSHPSDGAFDREYMNALFQFGYEQGMRDDVWQHEPPYMNREPNEPPRAHAKRLPVRRGS